MSKCDDCEHQGYTPCPEMDGDGYFECLMECDMEYSDDCPLFSQQIVL